MRVPFEAAYMFLYEHEGVTYSQIVWGHNEKDARNQLRKAALGQCGGVVMTDEEYRKASTTEDTKR